MSGLPSASAPQIRVILGLAAVYVLWGSTYPAIRVMGQTVPPLLGTGMRYWSPARRSLAWATGSFVAGRVPLPRDLLAGVTLQMLLGGLLTTAAALLAGEAASVRAEQVSWASAVTLAYLVIAGTLAAYTAYVWLLAHAPVSRPMTFAYANPVVAVAIGASLLGEQLTHAILAGSALILASVAGTLRSEA